MSAAATAAAVAVSSSAALPAPAPATPTRLAGAAPTPPPTESHVQVAVRCRPLNERERAAGRPPVLLCKSNSHEVAVVKRRSYAFDRVFGQYSTQSDVFKASGALSPDDDMAGIIPRCVRYIFAALQASSPQEFSVKVSFLQLYNEELKDLLAPEANKKLRLVEDPKRGGIYCQNLLEVSTTAASQVFELLEAGVKNRVTSETLMNEHSSRSHSIFTEYGNEIETLRSALAAARAKDGIFLPPAQFAEMHERLAGQAAQLAELEDELDARTRACKEMEDEVQHQKEELRALERAKQETADALAATQRELADTQATLAQTNATLTRTTLALRAHETNEAVLLANGERATALFRESEERAARLLAKIERKRVVDEANSSLAGAFSETSAAQIAAFQTRLAQHEKQQAAFVSEVATSVEQLQAAHAADMEELMRTLAKLQELTSAQRAQQAEEAAQEQLAGTQVADKLEQSIHEKQSATQSAFEALVALSVGHAAKLASELSAAKEQSAAFLAAVGATLSDARTEATQFLAAQRQQLLELQAAIDTSVGEQAKQLHANRESLVAALRATHAKQQQELDAMKRHVAQVVDQCVAAQAATLQEQTLLVEANATEQARQLQTVRAAAEREVLASVDALTSQSARQETRSTELQERVASMRSRVDELSTQHDALVATGVREQKQSIEVMATMQSAATEGLVEVVAEQRASTAAFAARREAASSDFVAKHDALRSTLSSTHVALETQLRANADATKRKFESVAQAASAVVHDATQQATQQRHELATYMKKRKVDEATGTTPTKKSVSFPSFVATKVVSELPADDELSAQTYSATASQASTASTSSVHSNESDDDRADAAAVAPPTESRVRPTEPSSTKSQAPPTPLGTTSKLGARAGVSASKLKPAAGAVDRKLKFGGKQPASSLQAPRKFR
ncbi:hypothetical protein PybrP1_002107 [[Pythium] brassicae (nom. inval.)]|nr:hypothetical protein PybrP1_002107 [[Pythium] brassicae (nom. inval.)]